jgi:hypothetical protein
MDKTDSLYVASMTSVLSHQIDTINSVLEEMQMRLDEMADLAWESGCSCSCGCANQPEHYYWFDDPSYVMD